jgi:hypothetical protein
MNAGNQLLKTNIMQYNMWKGPHFASSKKVEGSILFHEGFSSLRILWTPLCINVDTKGVFETIFDVWNSYANVVRTHVMLQMLESCVS